MIQKILKKMTLIEVQEIYYKNSDNYNTPFEALFNHFYNHDIIDISYESLCCEILRHMDVDILRWMFDNVSEKDRHPFQLLFTILEPKIINKLQKIAN